MAQHGTAWHRLAQHGINWHNMAQHGIARLSMAQHDDWDALQAVREKAWAAVGRLFSPPRKMTTVSHRFKAAYEKLLLPFEEVRHSPLRLPVSCLLRPALHVQGCLWRLKRQPVRLDAPSQAGHCWDCVQPL